MFNVQYGQWAGPAKSKKEKRMFVKAKVQINRKIAVRNINHCFDPF